jgi:hypothetical protein
MTVVAFALRFLGTSHPSFPAIPRDVADVDDTLDRPLRAIRYDVTQKVFVRGGVAHISSLLVWARRPRSRSTSVSSRTPAWRAVSIRQDGCLHNQREAISLNDQRVSHMAILGVILVLSWGHEHLNDDYRGS